MCTHSSVRMILHFFLRNKHQEMGEVQTGAMLKYWQTRWWQSYSIYHSTGMTGHWINLNTSAFDFPNRRLLMLHFSSSPSSAAWYFFYPESTEQQHGCPGRKWWRNRPTWKEPAAPDKFASIKSRRFFCLPKVWISKKMPMPVMLAKFLNDAWCFHKNTYTNNWKYGIYTSITSCMCEWKLDGVWEAPYQHKQLSYVPLRIAGQTCCKSTCIYNSLWSSCIFPTESYLYFSVYTKSSLNKYNIY